MRFTFRMPPYALSKCCGVAALLFSVAAGPLAAQNAAYPELNVGVGGTAVDVEAWAEEEPYDWGLVSFDIAVGGYYELSEQIHLGLEYAYHSLFWYTLQYDSCPSCYYPSYSYPKYDVNANSITLKGRAFLVAGFFAEAGIGPYLFNSGTAVGLNGALGYRVLLGESFAILPKLAVDAVSTDPALATLSLSVGSHYRVGFD